MFLFIFFFLSIKMLLVENPSKVRKIKIDTYPRSFNYCINCSWRCCNCPYYKFMRWISLMCFWEAQHKCCTRNVLHESRDKQDVTKSSPWAKGDIGGGLRSEVLKKSGWQRKNWKVKEIILCIELNCWFYPEEMHWFYFAHFTWVFLKTESKSIKKS